MRHTQRRFLASVCSTYRRVRLRAPRVENTTVHGASPPSRRNPVRYAGWKGRFALRHHRRQPATQCAHGHRMEDGVDRRSLALDDRDAADLQPKIAG